MRNLKEFTMFKKFIAIVLAYLFATTQVLDNTQNQKSLTDVLLKYEYMLSAHPSAHLDSFRKETMDSLTKELQDLKKNLTAEDVKDSLKNLVQKIPSSNDKKLYTDMISKHSLEQNIELLKSRSFLNKTFKGEGSNFTTSLSQNILLINALVIGLLVAAFMLSDNDGDSNHEIYGSSLFTFTSHGQDCFFSNAFIPTYYYEEARLNCESLATLPQTCRLGFVDQGDFGYNHPDDFFKSCSAQVFYFADKPQTEL